jgi:hypothetical protein
MALAAGAAAASPWLAGNWPAALAGAGLAAAGSAALALPRARLHFDPVDLTPREGFVLPSDEPYPGEGMLIGYTSDRGKPVRIPYNLFVRHLMLVGASGVGKTTLGIWLIWQQICRGGGVIFIDAKLDVDTRNTLAYLMRTIGRENDFYVLNVNDPEHSHTYNPLLNGDADEVASRLLNLLPSSENDPGSDYYRQSANHALTVIVGALKAAKLRYHFTDLTILLQSAPAMEWMLRQVPDGPERMALSVFLDKYRRRERGGATLDVNKMKDTLGGMAGRLALFAQGKFGRVFNTYAPQIDLPSIVTGNKVLYVMLPTMAKDTASINLGKMILSDLRTATARVQALPKAQRPWPPYLVFADEMGSYTMPGIARLFEQARSANIALLPAFQAFGNLREVSREFADILIQNTWSKGLFRFGSSDSAEAAAEIIGKSVRLRRSVSRAESSSASRQFIQAAPQSSESAAGNIGESWSETEDYRVSPDKLSGLGMGQCVLTIGARTYHINIPRITTPIDHGEDYGEFIPPAYPAKVPDGEHGIDLESRVDEFLME